MTGRIVRIDLENDERLKAYFIKAIENLSNSFLTEIEKDNKISVVLKGYEIDMQGKKYQVCMRVRKL